MTEPYPAVQITALRSLLAHLCSQFPGLHEIAGHEDLDMRMVVASDDPALSVRRKLDPGCMFPWGDALRDCSLTRRPGVSSVQPIHPGRSRG
jgi:N-acetylmuramoyl-L-alanine amidase